MWHDTMDDQHEALQEVQPVILAGGEGRRLFPLSHAGRPKPFLKTGGISLLQQAVMLTEPMQAPMIVCNRKHYQAMQMHMKGAGMMSDAFYVLEGVVRNTLPAMTAAAYLQRDENPVMVVMPSDHTIVDPEPLYDAFEQALPFARLGHFGIQPNTAETRYGYIRRGDAFGDGGYQVSDFVEKPSAAKARDYIRQGTYQWNSGIFMFTAQALLEEVERLHPEVLAAVEKTCFRAPQSAYAIGLKTAPMASLPLLSSDREVMEKTERSLVVPVDMDWCDAGTWSSYLSHLWKKPSHQAA